MSPMSRSTAIFIFLLSLVVIALGYNYFVRPFEKIFAPQEAATSEEVPGPGVAVEVQMLTTLSTREKILQIVAVPVTVSSPSSVSATLSWSREHRPGFVTLFGDRVSTTSALLVQGELAQAGSSQLPVLVAVDHEGGTVQRLSGTGFTRLPSWRELCQLDEEKREIVLKKSANELAAIGIDIVLAPMVDVASHSSVLGNRVCSGDQEKVISAGSQFARIFSEVGLLPVFKHFPGIGTTRRDLHTQFDHVTVTPAEAIVYRQLLAVFPRVGVMVTHVGVENQYADIPCSLSSACVGELHTTFPDALIFSDALDMKAAAYTAKGTTKTLPEVSLAALKAGNHVLLYGAGVTGEQLEEIISTIEAAVNSDDQVKARLDEAATAVIRYKVER